MKAKVKKIDERYVICLREDGIIIDILVDFLKEVKSGDILTIPDIRNDKKL
ncbi:hypothetical protein BD780_002966 [Clostridium tetanomorphum]|uniref:DUF3006 domain-containing protein n=1 Tax=Clostridium tetanomorphum TaxID=1553 RepID=A0A923EB70_CLOTT|nr:hypothetical protein [Clostridium tetanomorphum]MBC2397205.1 hypothetical protein [Clostridium tetanomorphum]MBP1862419.1 hypothetical protein [Clostridium tetanomorphum]NRS85741.1 hypothetical protein [Clostridium tetanomorphum]NRZ96250.1 hypothetical protein [Clostridium tetanomorphum]SQC02533.1 Uncharacterised protein [Clostridium tetanomorphum]